MTHQLLRTMVNIDVKHIIKCLISKLKFSYKFATPVLSQALNVSLLTFIKNIYNPLLPSSNQQAHMASTAKPTKTYGF